MSADQLERIAKQIKMLGFPIVMCCAFMYGAWAVGLFIGNEVVIPIRDVVSDHFKQATKTLEDMGQAAEKTADVQQSNSEVLQAIGERSTDHYELTKKTNSTVEEIKSLLAPPKVGASDK